MLQIIIDFGTRHLGDLAIPLHIYGYGLMMVLGFLCGIYLARWRARRFGENPDTLTQVGLLALVGGILGARLAYVIEQIAKGTPNAPQTIGQALNITSGGLIYYGGVILAMLIVLVYLRLKRLPMRRYLDILAPCLMVGLAFGRAGCLLNGCCYGSQCRDDWPLATHFPMFSHPLLKVDGRANPFSDGTEGPSPVYGAQLDHKQVKPDARLVDQEIGNALGRYAPLDQKVYLHQPRYLHGPLAQDQLATMFSDEAQARKKFEALAGPAGFVDYAKWEKGLSEKDGFLRGSEFWDEAMHFSRGGQGLSFAETWAYLQSRREVLTRMFDVDKDGVLNDKEKRNLNAYLQQDLYALAGEQHALAVKPSQAIGIVNAALLAGLLLAFSRLRRREGQAFALLGILYPITRFIEELIRADNPHDLWAGLLTHNQYTSLILLLAGIIMWLTIRRLGASAGPFWAQRLAAAKTVGTRSDRKSRISHL